MTVRWNKVTVNGKNKHYSLLAFTKGEVGETKVYILTLFLITISVCVS